MELIELPMVGDINESDIPTVEEYNFWTDAFKTRTFYIDFEIDDDYRLMEIAKCIMRFNYEDHGKPIEERQKIYILIHSFGGDAHQSAFFCDMLIASKTPIVTVALGACMSAACEILMAGHRRYAFRHSILLIHSGHAAFSGTAEQIDAANKNYKKMQAQSKEYILDRTNIDEKLYKANAAKDWYINSEDFVRLGIVDKVIENLDEIFE